MARAASSHALASLPRWRAATKALAARRLTSHSQGPNWHSSKSLMAKTSLRSAEANTPKLDTCMSPQSSTCRPVCGVDARSAAMTAADPRRNANGDCSMRAWRTGTSCGIRVLACSRRIRKGSTPRWRTNSPWLDRGTDSRSALPVSMRSSTDGCRDIRTREAGVPAAAACPGAIKVPGARMVKNLTWGRCGSLLRGPGAIHLPGHAAHIVAGG